MEYMKFDLIDFCDNKHAYPDTYRSDESLDKEKYHSLQNTIDKECDRVNNTFENLKARFTTDYFFRTYAAQTKALEFAEKVFPAYRFIFPEDAADDWLSIVGWIKKYPTRDHSLHQPLSAYIVQKLLGFGEYDDSFLTPKGRLLKYCVDSIHSGGKTDYLLAYISEKCPFYNEMSSEEQKEWIKDVFYEACVISALFHDLGYPWQFIRNLSKKTLINNKILVSNIEIDKDAIFELVKNRLILYPFVGYNQEKKKTIRQEDLSLLYESLTSTHGAPGGIAFIGLNEEFSNRNISTRQVLTYMLIIDWASIGILMHDMPDLHKVKDKETDKVTINKELQLSFDKDPLSSIVAMADLLEEFERPQAFFHDQDDENVQLSYNTSCVASEILTEEDEDDKDKKIMVVRYWYEDKLKLKEQAEFKDKEVKKYLDGPDAFIDIRSLGYYSAICKLAKIEKTKNV